MFCFYVIYIPRVNNILSNDCSLPVSVSVKIVYVLLTFLVLVVRPGHITFYLFVVIILFKRR